MVDNGEFKVKQIILNLKYLPTVFFYVDLDIISCIQNLKLLLKNYLPKRVLLQIKGLLEPWYTI